MRRYLPPPGVAGAAPSRSLRGRVAPVRVRGDDPADAPRQQLPAEQQRPAQTRAALL